MAGYPTEPRRTAARAYPEHGSRGTRYGSEGYHEDGAGSIRRPGGTHPGEGYRTGHAVRERPDHLPGGRAVLRHRRDATGGAEGNERLTGLAGAVLLVLFAAEGLTILAIRQLLTLHFFLGMLLIGPVALKAGSTVYRFARYYTGAPEYRRKGPPAPLLRLLGPVVLVMSLSVIGTGVMLAVEGPGAGLWLFFHKATFVLWFGAMTIHVLVYVWRLPRLVGGDLPSGVASRAQQVLGGRRARWLLLTASVLTGLLLALLTVHSSGAWLGFHGIAG